MDPNDSFVGSDPPTWLSDDDDDDEGNTVLELATSSTKVAPRSPRSADGSE